MRRITLLLAVAIMMVVMAAPPALAGEPPPCETWQCKAQKFQTKVDTATKTFIERIESAFGIGPPP